MTSRDVMMTGGAIWTGAGHVDALALRGGRVLAVGDVESVRARVGADAEVIDLDGRRAIPGLIDSHVHFVRAGLTWNDIVRWDGLPTLSAGLRRLTETANRTPDGTWLRVLGSWHPGQFDEKRGPTLSELDAAAPDHPVYVQLLYEEAMLNSTGIAAALGETDPPGGEIERDAGGTPTGRIRGTGAFAAVLGRISPPTRSAQLASTRTLMRDLNAVGITGVIDPGGFGVGPESYGPLFDLWRANELTVRARLYLVPAERGREVDLVREWVRYVQPGFGDGWLRYVGMGEILTFGCHDLEGVRPFTVTNEARRELLEMSRLLAGARWPIHLHAILDSTIDVVLDVWEEVDREVGLPHPSSLAHAEQIGARNLHRARDMGLGIAVQDRFVWRAADSAAMWGDEVAAGAPPLRTILDMGIPLGAGTDGTVVSSFDPWRCLWWLVTGGSQDGSPSRSSRQRLSIEEALVAYTAGSAWFSQEQESRGRLLPGMAADIAVLDRDVFALEPEELLEVGIDLTMVGGEVVHATAAFEGAAG